MRSHAQHMGCKLVILLALSLGVPLLGQNSGQLEAGSAIVSPMPASDVPARCAELVAGAPGNEQAAVAASLISAVAKHHPGAMNSSLVGISAKVPKVATAVAVAAVEANPDSAQQVIAALAAVPGVVKAEIITVVISAAPSQAVPCLQARTSTRSRLSQPEATRVLAASVHRSKGS